MYDGGAARLLDLGDGVALFELKTKLGVIGTELIEVGLELLAVITERFGGLVVANPQKHFSLGANLTEIRSALVADDLAAVDQMILRGQEWMTALRSLSVPVVSAGHGLALGGGCELLAAGWASVAQAEARIGLVESNVGLVPGWGGLVEQLRRRINPLALRELTSPELTSPELASETMTPNPAAPMANDLLLNELLAIFEQLRTARIATDPSEAKELAYLLAGDRVVAEKKSLPSEAKREVLQLSQASVEAPVESDLYLAGAAAHNHLTKHLDGLQESGKVVDHDVVVCERLIPLLCGTGDEPAWVEEGIVRSAERENLVELAATEATQARIAYTLETGQVLKN